MNRVKLGPGLLIAFLMSFSFSAMACLEFKGAGQQDVLALYQSAQRVLNAEDGKCDITDREKRAICNCQYRAAPLLTFKKALQAFTHKYQDKVENASSICLSRPSGETITVMLKGYQAMSHMCDGIN